MSSKAEVSRIQQRPDTLGEAPAFFGNLIVSGAGGAGGLLPAPSLAEAYLVRLKVIPVIALDVVGNSVAPAGKPDERRR